MHGHQDLERRAVGIAVALDDAPMVADDLRDQSKSEASAGRLGGDEGIEEPRQDFERDAGPVVDDAELERQTDRLVDPVDL